MRRSAADTSGTRIPRGVFYGWWIVAGGFAIQMLSSLLFYYSFGAYFVYLQEAFGWSRTMLSGAFSLSRMESGILGPFQGWLIDRFGPRAVMRIGIVIFAVGLMLFSQIHSAWQYYGAFLVMALLSVVAWVWQPRLDDDRIQLVWCTDDNPVRRGQTELFNEMYPKYRLRIDPQNATMEKVIVQSLAGVGPDLFDCYNVFQLSAFVRSGIALDCTEQLMARGILPEHVWPTVRPMMAYEGRMYGFPRNASSRAIWYNKKIFDRHGEPYPTDDWTWDDFIEIGKRLTVRNDRGQITQFALIGYWDWKVAHYQYGADMFTPEGTRCTLDSPEATAAMQFSQDLIYKYELIPTPGQVAAISSAGGWGFDSIAPFGAERSAMALGGRWWLCILRDPSYDHLDLGAVSLPAGPSRRAWGYGGSTLVNAAGKNIEGALCFLECMHSKEWSELINRQADALGPVIEHSYSEEFLFNPQHPEEDYNAVWRASLEKAEPEQVSPFVNGQRVDRIMVKQTDMVKANVKSGAQAARDSAKEINKAIVEMLEIDPVARQKYREALTAGAWPAWDSPEDAPKGFYE